MNSGLRRFQQRLLAVLLAFGGVTLLSVCSDISGPQRPERGHVAFAPALPGSATAALGSSSTVIDNVRIMLRDGDGIVVLDTIVAFPATSDEVSISADVPVEGSSERFRAMIQLRSGDDVLFEGTQDVDVRPGQQSGPPPTIPLAYVGTGSNATSLTVAPDHVDLEAQGTQQLTATVRDGNGIVIPGVPLGWSSSDEDIASVSADGLVTAKGVRGAAVIVARTFGGVIGSANAVIVFPPSQLRISGGGGQIGPVARTLPLPFVVELLASDGVGVPNTTVEFTTNSAGATISPAAVTTDANGRASAILTLGTSAGKVTFTASAAGFTASIDANAVAADANRIAIENGNGQSAPTGTTLPSPLSVRVTDEFGNPGVGQQVLWTAAAGSLAQASSTTDATGIATNTYTVPIIAGEHLVSATLSTGGAVAFTATALARPPSKLVVVAGGVQSGTAGSQAQPLVVRVVDAIDQPAANVTVNWNAGGSATPGSSSTVTNQDGVTSIAAFFGTSAGPSTITATVTGASPAVFTLTATPGAAASMTIVSGDNQVGNPGNPLPIAPTVQVSDAFGNPLSGVDVTFGGASGGGSVTGALQQTDETGIAIVGSWILGGLSAGQTLTATAGLLSVTFHATANLVGTPASLIAVAGDGQIVTAFQPLQPIVVEVITSGETPVPNVTVKFTVMSGGATPTTASVVSDSAGHATFVFPSAGAAGAGVVQACVMPACTITTTLAYNVITTGSIWTGTTSSDWFTPANWSTGVVPGSGADVFIAAGTPNFPVLTNVAIMNELFMAAGSLINIGIFDMQIGSKVTTTDAFIVGTGTFVLSAASASMTGSFPNVQILGTLTAGGTTTVNGNLTIESGGRVDVGLGDMTVSGGLTVNGGGRLTMNNAAGLLTINGDAFIAGQDMGDAELTAGLLDVKGNLTATVFGQAFRGAGTHTTRLSGTGLQTVNFFQPGGAFGRFQNLEITNSSANGVTMSSNVFVNGTLVQGGRLTVPAGQDLTVIGALTLQSGSNTSIVGSINFGVCTDLGGITLGFSCVVLLDSAPPFRRR